MATYMVPQGGFIVNIATADDPAFAASQGWVAYQDGAQIGWLWNGSTASPPPPDPAIEEAALAALALKNHKARLRSELTVLEQQRREQVFASDPEWLNTQIKINKLNDQLNEV